MKDYYKSDVKPKNPTQLITWVRFYGPNKMRRIIHGKSNTSCRLVRYTSARAQLSDEKHQMFSFTESDITTWILLLTCMTYTLACSKKL